MHGLHWAGKRVWDTGMEDSLPLREQNNSGVDMVTRLPGSNNKSTYLIVLFGRFDEFIFVTSYCLV